jgi:hypothetical protein
VRGGLRAPAAAGDVAPAHARALIWLALCAVLVAGLWARERALLAAEQLAAD